MNRAGLAIALSAAFVLSAFLGGCKSEEKDKGRPGGPAAPSASTRPEAAPAAQTPRDLPDQAPSDKARIAELERQLRTAADDAARAKAYAESLRLDMAEDRKAAAASDEKLLMLSATIQALRERLEDTGQSDWVVRVEAEAFEMHKDVQVKDDPRASGGKALVLGKDTSSAETTLDVKAGFYRVVAVGIAPKPDDDAMTLVVKAVDKATGEIDVEQRVCFDKDFEALADASNAPAIAVKRAGKLKVIIKPTEERGMMVDRVELRVHVPK